MKTEDIDKKIGMPDVDEEWAKFEHEVIGLPTVSRKPLYWGIGIAASIALLVGFFLFGHDTEEPQQVIAQQTTTTKSSIVESKQKPSSELLAEATSPTTEEVAVEELQGHIGGLNIEESDSVRQARRDSLLNQREINMDSMLIEVNGTPIPL